MTDNKNKAREDEFDFIDTSAKGAVDEFDFVDETVKKKEPSAPIVESSTTVVEQPTKPLEYQWSKGIESNLIQPTQAELQKAVVEPQVYANQKTQELKSFAVKKQEEIAKNYASANKAQKIISFASQYPEIKQLQDIEARLTAMGKVTKPEDIAEFKQLVAQRNALLETDVAKINIWDKAPIFEQKKVTDFDTPSEYGNYQNEIKNSLVDFDKKKKEFEEVSPNFQSTKLKDVLSTVNSETLKQNELIEKIKQDQNLADESIRAAQELNKDKLQKLGFFSGFAEGLEQTTLSNTIADLYLSGKEEDLQKALENIYTDSVVFPKETTTAGDVGELLGGQVKPLAVGIGGAAASEFTTGNPLLGIGIGSTYYGRMGVGSGLMDGYMTARSQGLTQTEAYEIAKKQAIAGGVGGTAEGVVGAIPFLGKPLSKIATTPFKKAVMEGLADNGVDAVVAGISQYAQNKNLNRLGLDVDASRGVAENMAAEFIFGAGMNLAFYGGSKILPKTYNTIVNGLAKMPLSDIQTKVDEAVKAGVLDEAKAQSVVMDIVESGKAQSKLKGIDVPEKSEDTVIDLQKQIDKLEKDKANASVAVASGIDAKIEELSAKLQIEAGIPLNQKEKLELSKLQKAKKEGTEYDKDRLEFLQKRENAVGKKEANEKANELGYNSASHLLNAVKKEGLGEFEKVQDVPKEVLEQVDRSKPIEETKVQEMPPQEVKAEQPTVLGKEVEDAEYNEFIDKGKVSEERLNDIANKVKNREPLSDREIEIFTDKTSEINKIIAGKEEGSGVLGDVEIKNEGKAETPTKENVQERLSINNPFYKKVEDALVKLGLIEKYNPETKTGDVVGGYVQGDGRGGFAAGDMYFEANGVIKYRKDGNVVEFDRNGNVISENTKQVAQENKKIEIEATKSSIASLEKTRDSEAFKYKEVTESDALGNRKKVKRLKTSQELKESTDKINAAIDKAKEKLKALEQSPPTQEVKAEQPTVLGKEEGSGVDLGGGIKNNVADEKTYVLPISEIDNLRSQKPTDLATGNAVNLEKDLTKNGIKEPLVITYYPNEGKAVLTDGHNRLDVAKDMGAEKLPIRIVEKYTDAPNNAKDWTPPKTQEAKAEQPTVSDNPALSSVESTAKALEGKVSEGLRFNANFNLPLEQTKTPKQVSEAYHKAKADGSNPELVKAVEELLTNKTQENATKEIEQQASVSEERKSGVESRETTEPSSSDSVQREEGSAEKEIGRNTEDVISVVGDKGTVKFTDKTSVPFEYAVIEASDLQASHLPSGERNIKHGIAEAQPKERTDIGSKRAQDKIATEMNFDEVAENTNAYSGAPVVNERGEVIQGNNRTLGIKQHYKRGGKEYKAQLASKAKKFGLDASEIEGMKEPVLVRKVKVNDTEAIKLGNADVKDLETGGKRRIDALTTSRKLSPQEKKALANIVFGEEKPLKEALRDNIKKVHEIIGKHLSDAERNTAMKDGQITANGMDDYAAVVKHLMFDGGDAVLPQVFEDLPNVAQKGIEKALPHIFAVEGEKSLLPDLQNAMIGLREYLGSGAKSVDEWANTTDMFIGKAPKDIFTPTELKIIDLLSSAEKQTDIKKAFAKYEELANGKEGDMFGGKQEPLSRKEAVKQTFNIDEKELGQKGETGTTKPVEETPTEAETIFAKATDRKIRMAERDKILEDGFGEQSEKAKFVFKNFKNILQTLESKGLVKLEGDCF